MPCLTIPKFGWCFSGPFFKGSDKISLTILQQREPAGSGSAPQSPNTYPEPSPDRTIMNACGACPPCPQPFPEHAIIRIPAGTKKTSHFCEAFFVIPLGFEPRTHTLKVYCSTSWATESLFFYREPFVVWSDAKVGFFRTIHNLKILFFHYPIKQPDYKRIIFHKPLSYP